MCVCSVCGCGESVFGMYGSLGLYQHMYVYIWNSRLSNLQRKKIDTNKRTQFESPWQKYVEQFKSTKIELN